MTFVNTMPRLTFALAVVLILALLASSPAQAHQQVVTLHNNNDAAWNGAGHHVWVVCDGTNNDHRFGAEFRLRNGNTPIRFDFGSGGECNDGRFDSEIVAIRWACHGAKGEWRAA
jgi:opacity protein-like surface antigen